MPNPRKRADLFEVARHSWLSEYAQLVEFITSSTTLPSDVQNTNNGAAGAAASEEYAEPPMMTRSASVREASKAKPSHSPAVGGLAKQHGNIDPEAESSRRTPKDAKRRTVQLEYVAPTTQTQRGAEAAPSKSRTQAPPVEAADVSNKSSPREPPAPKDGTPRAATNKRPQSSHKNAAPSRPSRDTRAISDNAYMTRPQTGGSMQSAASMGLQSRPNYGQPAPPAVADTNAQGRIQQPSDDTESMGRTHGSVPPKVAQMTGFHNEIKASGGAAGGGGGKGHKRSNTLGDLGNKIMGRSGSIFGGGRSKKQQGDTSRKYPPVSMSKNMFPGEEAGPRPSVDSKHSRRSFSLGIGKKRSGSINGSQGSGEKEKRRFSLVPPGFSLKAIGLGGKSYGSAPPSEAESQQDLPIQNPRPNQSRGYGAHDEPRHSEPYFNANLNQSLPHQDTANSSPVYHGRYGPAQMDNRRPNAVPAYVSGNLLNTGSESSVDMRRPLDPQAATYQQQGYTDSEGHDGRRVGTSRGNKGTLNNDHKRFSDAYDQGDYKGHEGSSGAAKRVMDFFRRRGKARGGGEER